MRVHVTGMRTAPGVSVPRPGMVLVDMIVVVVLVVRPVPVRSRVRGSKPGQTVAQGVDLALNRDRCRPAREPAQGHPLGHKVHFYSRDARQALRRGSHLGDAGGAIHAIHPPGQDFSGRVIVRRGWYAVEHGASYDLLPVWDLKLLEVQASRAIHLG